jgi:hypothetical protein
MFHKVLALAAVALLTTAAAPAAKAPPPKTPAAKAPAAKAAAPKAPAQKAATPAGAFDARDPATLVTVLSAAGAKAQVGRKVEDTVAVTVTSAAANFQVLFVGCNAQGRACQAAVYDFGPIVATPSLPQLNGFNQSSAMCRAYQDKAGKAHLLFSSLVFPATTRDQVLTQLAAWQGCLGDFGAFSKDPISYLASAP